MLRKDQFLREIRTREVGFDPDHVMRICDHHPSDLSEETMAVLPDSVDLHDVQGTLSKASVESMFAISLPLADRNLFVALKQERFAGKDWNMVKFICKDLLEAVAHVHSKGIIHADLKPLNMVRVNGDWRLIDLDACCRIGVDHTGLKSSSAYSPPESIFVDPSAFPPVAVVRSEEHRRESGLKYDLLLADPSFDVWSLGCIFYQMCTDCRMLFQGGQDDNLLADESGDNLFSLEEWSEDLKAQKLSLVHDDLARNLLSQMLMKSPSQRPSLSRVLDHPFFTGRKVARLVGQEAEFDVFLSYRVWSDKQHVKKLHDDLTSQGLRVYWDAKCLEDGQNWEEGFCSGVMNCRFFVPVLSKRGLANFSTLSSSSSCDNVLLEHRLTLELKEMGLIEGIFPLIVGDEVAGSEPLQVSLAWGPGGWIPECRDECVLSVEASTCQHLASQALGTPHIPNRSVLSVLNEIKKMQGALIDGDYEAKMNEAVHRIVALSLKHRPIISHSSSSSSTSPPSSPSHSAQSISSSHSAAHQVSVLLERIEDLEGTLEMKESMIRSLERTVSAMKGLLRLEKQSKNQTNVNDDNDSNNTTTGDEDIQAEFCELFGINSLLPGQYTLYLKNRNVNGTAESWADYSIFRYSSTT